LNFEFCISFAIMRTAVLLKDMKRLDEAQVVAVVGAQWGDEGKGKIVDYLAEKMDIVARGGGGANAGHTIIANGKKFVFHLIPSGVLHDHGTCIIGNGCVVHLPTLLDELTQLREAGIDPKGRVFVSDRAHLLFQHHILADKAQEEKRGKKIGTTCRGIGPAYEDKVSRRGIRAGELLGDFSAFAEKLHDNAERRMKRHGFEMDIETEISLYKDLYERFQDIITDTTHHLHQAAQNGEKILVEGAQGCHLDIDFGTYPFVTSSITTSSGACSGTGMPPNKIDFVLGIIKAYTTRVGEGPFPSETNDTTGEYLQEKGGEFGATTGRPRRCGWFDAVVAKHSAMISGIDAWNLTKLDVLSGLQEIQIVTDYVMDGEKLTSFPADIHVLEKVEVENDHCARVDERHQRLQNI
jgi:adenylosuccinate synthase